MKRLKTLLAAAVAEGPVTLASGAVSDFYIDARLVTLTPEGSTLAGEALLDLAAELGATAIAGPTVAACPLVSAVGVLAHQRGRPLKLVYVRAKAKGHGMQKAVEGPPLAAEDRVLVVDDVLTSGGSLLQAIATLRADTEATLVGAAVLVDREAGGAQALAAAEVPLRALFTRSSLLA